MKTKIVLSYLPEEEHEASADLFALQRRHPGSRARRSKAHLPTVSVYMRISPGDFSTLTPCDFCGNRAQNRGDFPCKSCPAVV